MEQIKIGNKTYKVTLAKTLEEQEKGLQGIKELPQDEGMLFVFEEPDHRDFWMRDTSIPLDIVFIDEDLKVISVKQGEPNSDDFISEDNVQYVLEVNQNSGIQPDDELDFTDKQVKKMYMLDSNGETQMELEGGERIFSRPDTKTLIKFAKKASLTGKDSDYKALGVRAIKFINQQDSRDAEYVESKK